MSEDVVIKRVEAFVFRHPIAKPVATSFGVMRDRPAVFVRLEDQHGAFGWGEIFANWPVAGAEHRARLLDMDIADLVLGLHLSKPSELFSKLSPDTHVRAVQCGELGPFRQVIAGLDAASWDLFARKRGLPLRQLLREKSSHAVPVYASGIAIHNAVKEIPKARMAGFSAFKVKVGFDLKTDVSELRRAARELGEGEALFADANQAWHFASAKYFVDRVADVELGWLEEPIRVDDCADDWQQLAEASSVPLAGGENIATTAAFENAIELGALNVIQPDVAKWGGITGIMAVARKALAAGRRFCPHFLGGGIGLLASAHCLAAAGGDGLLEVDLNSNPLRSAFLPDADAFSGGQLALSAAVGLGVEALPEEILPLQTLSVSRHV
ncbi:MAG: mandelate racemase/muconate lactonizing enzyme family protein [Filomicrobium sp.]